MRVRYARLVVLAILLALAPAARAERWFKPPCQRGPDGRCIEEPCDPFLDEIRALAAYRRLADDPGCPGHAEASALADQRQTRVDEMKAKMSTACIRKATEPMRQLASVDVLRSYAQGGTAIVLVRYTNNSQRTVAQAAITCAALRGKDAVATGKGVAVGPIASGATRELPVRIDLRGATFECARCELELEN